MGNVDLLAIHGKCELKYCFCLLMELYLLSNNIGYFTIIRSNSWYDIVLKRIN